VALEYYQKTIYPKVDRVYTIGERPSSIAFVNNPSGSGQNNTPHLVELLAAYQAIHFVKTAHTITNRADNDANHFQFGRAKDIAQANGTVAVNTANLAADVITLNYFYGIGEGQSFWNNFAAFGLFLKYYEQNFERDENEPNASYYDKLFKEMDSVAKKKTSRLNANFTADLDSFKAEYKLWLTGLGQTGSGAGFHRKPFAPFNWNKPNSELAHFINGYFINNFNETEATTGWGPWRAIVKTQKLLTQLNKVTLANNEGLAKESIQREAKFLKLFHTAFTSLFKPDYSLTLQQ
jgi:hypothetical protein